MREIYTYIYKIIYYTHTHTHIFSLLVRQNPEILFLARTTKKLHQQFSHDQENLRLYMYVSLYRLSSLRPLLSTALSSGRILISLTRISNVGEGLMMKREEKEREMEKERDIEKRRK